MNTALMTRLQEKGQNSLLFLPHSLSSPSAGILRSLQCIILLDASVRHKPLESATLSLQI